MNNFWKKLEKPIFALAPMADVTDAAFRRIIAKYSKVPGGVPYITWTEFTSADGLALAPEAGRKKLLKNLEYAEEERPIVAQFFTSTPENMKKAAELASELGFDGVDINMGCPDRSIEKQGAGAALMKDAKRSRELIRAAKEGAGDLPVSIKIRLGYNKPVLDEWLPEILEEGVVAVTIHARTRKEMSKVPARWEFIKQAVEIRDKSGKDTLILGNGDVLDVDDAKRRVAESGCDGAMFGRAIFGNPWLFSGRDKPDIKERLNVLAEHTKLFEELMGEYKSFSVMKKHFKAYISEFEGAAELRARLMEVENSQEAEMVIKSFIDNT